MIFLQKKAKLTYADKFISWRKIKHSRINKTRFLCSLKPPFMISMGNFPEKSRIIQNNAHNAGIIGRIGRVLYNVI